MGVDSRLNLPTLDTLAEFEQHFLETILALEVKAIESDTSVQGDRGPVLLVRPKELFAVHSTLNRKLLDLGQEVIVEARDHARELALVCLHLLEVGFEQGVTPHVQLSVVKDLFLKISCALLPWG